MMFHSTFKIQFIGLIVWLALCFAAAGVGGFASINAASFYGQLIQPTWSPPGWLFGPVWSVLYTMMGVAAWLVWRQYGMRLARTAFIVFVVQLALNALWTWLFFTWHLGAIALIEILALWALIATTIVLFWPLNRLAAMLLVPYLAWVSFASALNLALWKLNPAVLG
jgi:tryptophan-rich sensory protein